MFKSYKKIISSLMAMLLILSVASAMSGSRAQAAAASSHPLKDLQLFGNTQYGQWAGAGSPLSIETTSSSELPIDTNVTYNGLPSMRFNITSDGSNNWGWWSTILADNWETYSLVPYYAHGALEFNIKGAAGGEAFTVGMQDHDLRRDPVNYNTPALQSSSYVTVTTDWQHVRIPLADLIPQGSIFDLNQVYLLSFGWELDFILKMQDQTSGGFYHMVQPSSSNAPDQDTTPRYIADVNGSQTNVRPTDDAASAAAALAEAAISFQQWNPIYAHTLLTAAQRGWDYLVANPGNVSGPGPYNVSDDSADRLWAAAALYRATGKAQYNQYFLANYQQFASAWDGSRDNPGNAAHFAFLDYMKATHPDPTARAWFATKFEAWSQSVLQRSEQGPWHNTLADGDYYWGSNSVVLDTTEVLAVGSIVSGGHNLLTDVRIIQAVEAGMNYILGINPLQLSYVSGEGTNSISLIFSAEWSYEGIPGIPKGYLPGGPNSYTNPLLSCGAPAKCYLENDSNWSTNESDIGSNAELVLNAALLSQIP